jgi:hypothetical protein
MSFKVQNWPAYEAVLRRRDSLTLWIEDPALECWQTIGPSGAGSVYERGHSDRLDAAHGVQAGVAPDRGPDTSVLSLMGLTISAPDHTTVSRRAATLSVIQAPSVPHGPLHVLIDSTGLQISGCRPSMARSRAGRGASCIWRLMPPAA